MAPGNRTIILLLPLALVAAGCASPGGAPAPIEDRVAGKAPAATSAPAAAASAPAVRAIPLPSEAAPAPSELPLEVLPADEAGELPAPEATVMQPATPLNPAVQTLLASARQAQDAGEWERAQSALERAVKLSPDDPALWTELAYTHLRRGESDQAQEFADRAQSLAAATGSQDPAIWQLVAEIEAARTRARSAAP